MKSKMNQTTNRCYGHRGEATSGYGTVVHPSDEKDLAPNLVTTTFSMMLLGLTRRD
jgi:hypothetical protein